MLNIINAYKKISHLCYRLETIVLLVTYVLVELRSISCRVEGRISFIGTLYYIQTNALELFLTLTTPKKFDGTYHMNQIPLQMWNQLMSRS